MPEYIYYDESADPKYKEGYCPKCNSQDLEYGDREVGDGYISWDVVCNDCKWEGLENNSIVFTGYMEEKPKEVPSGS